MTENIVTGKKFKILTDATQDIWDRISFWTKASDVYYDDNSTVESNKPTNILRRSTYYQLGQIAYESTAPSWVMLRCSTAGTTSRILPTTYSTINSVGQSITDGSAKFTVCDVRPSNTLSSSSYEIPAMSLVNDMSSQLMANGDKIYFDYHNGKYGINTSSTRSIGTFMPFSNTRYFDAFISRHNASSLDLLLVQFYKDSSGNTWLSFPSYRNGKYVSVSLAAYGSGLAMYDVTFNADGWYCILTDSTLVEGSLLKEDDFYYKHQGDQQQISVPMGSNSYGCVLFYFYDLNRINI